MGHHAEAGKTLRSLQQLQRQQGVDSNQTAACIQEADYKLASQRMNSYLALGLHQSCTNSEVSLIFACCVVVQWRCCTNTYPCRCMQVWQGLQGHQKANHASSYTFAL